MSYFYYQSKKIFFKEAFLQKRKQVAVVSHLLSLIS